MSGAIIIDSGLVLVPDPALNAWNCTNAFAGLLPATLQMMLNAAQTALDGLITSGQPTTVTYGSGDGQKSVTYSRTNEFALRNHIRELRAALGLGRGRRALSIGF